MWSTDKNEDDPGFLKADQSVPRSCSIIIEELLNQLIEEDTDLGRGDRSRALGGDDSAAEEAGVLSKGVEGITANSADYVHDKV